MRDWYPVARGEAEWDKAPNNSYKNSEEYSKSKTVSADCSKVLLFLHHWWPYPITWPTASVNQVLNNGPLQPAAFTLRSYRKTAPSNMEVRGGERATLKSLDCLIIQQVALQTRSRSRPGSTCFEVLSQVRKRREGKKTYCFAVGRPGRLGKGHPESLCWSPSLSPPDKMTRKISDTIIQLYNVPVQFNTIQSTMSNQFVYS